MQARQGRASETQGAAGVQGGWVQERQGRPCGTRGAECACMPSACAPRTMPAAATSSHQGGSIRAPRKSDGIIRGERENSVTTCRWAAGGRAGRQFHGGCPPHGRGARGQGLPQAAGALAAAGLLQQSAARRAWLLAMVSVHPSIDRPATGGGVRHAPPHLHEHPRRLLVRALPGAAPDVLLVNAALWDARARHVADGQQQVWQGEAQRHQRLQAGALRGTAAATGRAWHTGPSAGCCCCVLEAEGAPHKRLHARRAGGGGSSGGGRRQGLRARTQGGRGRRAALQMCGRSRRRRPPPAGSARPRTCMRQVLQATTHMSAASSMLGCTKQLHWQ